MMNKHTPGPWHCDRGDHAFDVKSGSGLVAALSTDGKRLDALEADARLIAASPVMLATLEDVLRYLQKQLSYYHDEPTAQLMERVYAVIHQALGES